MNTNIKKRVLNAFTTHPSIAMFGIGLAITFIIGAAIGMISPEQALAMGGKCTHC